MMVWGDRLRVLIVVAASEIGGAERVVSLLRGLNRRRFGVWVASHGHGLMLDEYRQVAAGVWSLNLLNIFHLPTVIRLARLMRRLQCHIVHTHLWTTDVLGGLAATLAGVPIRVATVHGGYFQRVEEHAIQQSRKAILSRVYRAEKDLHFVKRTPEIDQYYRAVDCFVLPSTREGFPNSLLEAMASGLPCVATRLEGITDRVIVHGENGFLFPSRDFEALSTLLVWLKEDHELRRRIGGRARETVVKRFSIADTARTVFQSYRELQSRGSASG